MITCAFFIAAVVHTLFAIILSPVAYGLDLFIAIAGAIAGRSRESIESDMTFPVLWRKVSKSWKKI